MLLERYEQQIHMYLSSSFWTFLQYLLNDVMNASQFILWTNDSIYIIVGVFVEPTYYIFKYKVQHQLTMGTTLIYYGY